MRASVVLLSCLVLLQAIPVEKKFLQLGQKYIYDRMDGDVELTSDNLKVVETDDHEVQLLAAEDSDLMINQLEAGESQSMDDETPLNSAYFEDDGTSDLVEDASQNIVEDLQLIGQNDANNNLVDENHQVMDIQNENLVEDNQNVNDEIQQELASEQETVQVNADDYLIDQEDNQIVDTLQVIDGEQQQQLVSTDVQSMEVNESEETEQQAVDPNDPGMMNEENEQQSNCIQLYSQCYYKGESIKACNDLGLMKDFPYEVKSLKIPYGTTLTIYDHPNYEGEKHTFSQSEECLTNVVVLTQIAF